MRFKSAITVVAKNSLLGRKMKPSQIMVTFEPFGREKVGRVP